MLRRIQSRLARQRRRQLREGVPWQPQTTFKGETDVEWYEPVLAGPASFAADCSGKAALDRVIPIIERLEADDYLAFTLDFYRAGLKRFGNHWQYADITTVLSGICSNLTIDAYMEVGVRRGRSLAIVGAMHPKAHLVGFDMWITGYGGNENPGPALVRSELTKVGHTGTLELIEGNSRETVPAYFGAHPQTFFDVITIDGDHSARGARIDLENAIPRLKIGGVLVFDDITNPAHRYLRDVWNRTIASTDRFLTTAFEEPGYGVALAVRAY